MVMMTTMMMMIMLTVLMMVEVVSMIMTLMAVTMAMMMTMMTTKIREMYRNKWDALQFQKAYRMSFQITYNPTSLNLKPE